MTEGEVSYLSAPGVYDIFMADLYNGRKIPEEITKEILANLTFGMGHYWYF